MMNETLEIKTNGINDEAENMPVEAYGVKGLKSRPWRKYFKNNAAFVVWCEKQSANIEVYGTRSLEISL